jgi:hypothetical protein
VQRRRRVSEIRRQSLQLAAHTRDLRDELQRLRARAATSQAPAGVSDAESVWPEAGILPGHDVLAQAQLLLAEMDRREREHWNEDDTVILLHLWCALQAAARRGYSGAELGAIIEALSHPGADTCVDGEE